MKAKQAVLAVLLEPPPWPRRRPSPTTLAPRHHYYGHPYYQGYRYAYAPRVVYAPAPVYYYPAPVYRPAPVVVSPAISLQFRLPL